jgi:hypothetical protein
MINFILQGPLELKKKVLLIYVIFNFQFVLL